MKTRDLLSLAILLLGIVLFIVSPILAIVLLAVVYYFHEYHSKRTSEPSSTFVQTATKKSLADPLMSHEDKLKYLASPKWQQLKMHVKLRDGFHCKKCNSKHKLEVHHITYQNLGAEHLEDLVTLCRTCHGKLHEELGYSRSGYYPIN